MFKRISKQVVLLLGLSLLLSSCALFEEEDYGPSRHVDVSDVQNAIPKDEPRSRGGNPESYVVNGKRYYVRDTAQGYKERGIASWYGYKFHGNKTSNGEVYDMYSMTAAHKTLPLPSYVRVTNLDNGRSIIVRVNDRGPFAKGRIIDLSYVAARKLDIVKNGTGRVEVEAITGADIAQGKGSAMIQIGAFVPPKTIVFEPISGNGFCFASHSQRAEQVAVLIPSSISCPSSSASSGVPPNCLMR